MILERARDKAITKCSPKGHRVHMVQVETREGPARSGQGRTPFSGPFLLLGLSSFPFMTILRK